MQATERLLWADIQRQYPNEWVLITEPEMGSGVTILSGIVWAHDPDKRTLFQKISTLPPLTLEHSVTYTGTLEHPTHAWRAFSVLNAQHTTT